MEPESSRFDGRIAIVSISIRGIEKALKIPIAETLYDVNCLITEEPVAGYLNKFAVSF